MGVQGDAGSVQELDRILERFVEIEPEIGYEIAGHENKDQFQVSQGRRIFQGKTRDVSRNIKEEHIRAHFEGLQIDIETEMSFPAEAAHIPVKPYRVGEQGHDGTALFNFAPPYLAEQDVISDSEFFENARPLPELGDRKGL